MNSDYRNIIACDPGWSGAIVFHPADCDYAHLSIEKMPDTPTGIAETLRRFHHISDTTFYIEQVGGFVGGRGNTGASMFRFGENFGILLGAAATLGCRIERVRPQKWIKAHGLGTRGEMTPGQWKQKLRNRAQELFPAQKVTLANADALLILDAARRGLI